MAIAGRSYANVPVIIRGSLEDPEDFNPKVPALVVAAQPDRRWFSGAAVMVLASPQAPPVTPAATPQPVVVTSYPPWPVTVQAFTTRNTHRETLMALNTVTLQWDLTDLLQAGLAATLSITPTAQISDSTDHILIPPVARTYTFSGGSGQLAGIVANDNANILPAGTGYLISVTASNGVVIVPQFQTQLNFANGAVQWLDVLSPVPSVTTSYQYLPLPSGTPSAGQVPVATGAGEASAWGTPASGFTNPMTTLGDLIYENATPAAARLAGDTSNTRKFLREQASGGVAQAPAWDTLQAGDIPDQPWQFRPETYNSKAGDGVVITDAVMTSGSPNLAATTSVPFTSTAIDGGKYILVSAAGGGTYTPKMFTISTVTDTGHAVLSANASSTTTGTPGAIAYFGTDCTAAIQSAINAAVTYASAHNGYAEVLFKDKIYIVAGAFVIGGATLGNAQLTLPVVDPTTTAQQVVLAFKGAMDTTPLMHWLQVNPQSSGTVLASVRTDGTNDGTNGPACVIGGPYNGYGGEVNGVFSNMLVRVQGIGMLLPYNATMGGIDLFGLLEADVSSLTVQTAAVVPTSAAPVPSLSNTANISNQWSFALRMPTTGNQVVCHVDRLSTEGLCIGLVPSEWTYANFIHVMYAICAVGPWCRPSGSMAHAAYINDVQAENCSIAVSPQSTGVIRMDIASLQAESISDSLIYDVSSQLQGTFYFRSLGSTGYLSSGIFHGSNSGTMNGGKHQRVINNLQDTGPVSSPQAAPATTVAWINYYYRDAWIEFNLSGGTLTSLTITSANNVAVAQPGAVGAGSYRFLLPSGASYTPVYSAGTQSHTVTLL